MTCTLPLPSPLPLWVGFGGPGWADSETAERHRREHCSAYSACLSRAAAEGWRGWSCVACDAASSVSDSHLVALPISSILLPGEREETDGGEAVVVTADLCEGRHRLLAGWGTLKAATSEGRQWVPAVLVGVANCPVCAATTLVPSPVLRDGYCQECKGYLVAKGSGVSAESGRSREDERRRRHRRHPAGMAARAKAVVAGVIGAVQEELWK